MQSDPSLIEKIRDTLFELIPVAIETAQKQMANMEDGIFFVDVKRALEPMLDGLVQIHSPMIEEYFVTLFKADGFFSNNDFYQFSVIDLDGYKKWSEFMKSKFAGYKMDVDERIIRDTAGALNFKNLMQLYLSKTWTEKEEEEFEAKLLESNGSMFLDESMVVPKILLTSYMRSGNALTRKFFETITGIATGSAMPNKYLIDFATQASGFKGDAYYDDKTWVYKTHHPFLLHGINDQVACKAIVCVRNPLDVFVSHLMLRLTRGHSSSTTVDIDQEFPEFWNQFLTEVIPLWVNFYDYWFEVIRQKRIPVLFMRYEDLVTNPYPPLKELLEFSLGVESIDDTFIDKRLKNSLEQGASGANTIYKPRSGKTNANLNRYTGEQLDKIRQQCKKFMLFFEYGTVKGKEPHETNLKFFEYDDDEDKIDHNFLECNQRTLKITKNKVDTELDNISIMKIIDQAPQVGRYYSKELTDENFRIQMKVFIKK